jgi:hypothetical protein
MVLGVGVGIAAAALATVVTWHRSMHADSMRPHSPPIVAVARPRSDSPPPPVLDLGPPLELTEIRDLPEEGVAITVGRETVLVGLDGTVIGRVEGRVDPGPPDPLTLRVDDSTGARFLLDPSKGRFVELPDRRYNRSPLAYGAEQVWDPDLTPGTSWIERGGRRIFELGLNGGDDSHVVSNDRDVVTATVYDDDQFGKPDAVPSSHRALDLRTGKTLAVPDNCDVGDRHGSRLYLTCGYDAYRGPKTLDLVQNGRRSTLFAPRDGGAWVAAAVSPDGKSLMAQWWSSGCGTQTVHLSDANGKNMRAPFGDRFADALGWTNDGRAIVAVRNSACRDYAAATSIYLLDGDDVTRIYATPQLGVDQTISSIGVWAPALH